MSDSVQITEIRETGSAAPSQWELELSDGRVAYVHYRHGKLRVGIGADFDDAYRNEILCALLSPFQAERECTWEEAEPYVIAAIAAA